MSTYDNHAYIRSVSEMESAKKEARYTCMYNSGLSGGDSDLIRAQFSRRDGAALVFSCYTVTREQVENEEKRIKEQKMKEIEKAYKEFYIAKELQYEQYKKDGKVHTDVYTEPDGSIRATSIKGDIRCDAYADDKGASSTCN